MKGRKNKNQDESANEKKWQDISDKSNESHRKAIENTEKNAELRRKSGDKDEGLKTQGSKDWQQLSDEENIVTRGRRGGYPKNIYNDNSEKKAKKK